jgi:cytoskeletal protein CcmA (bactofilin family)
MWKRDDVPDPAPVKTQFDEQKVKTQTMKQAEGQRATIGQSITIRGEVTGNEDLLIQGQVDGTVDLKNQGVTVGQEGKVKANITGRLVVVEGEVEGDLRAEEQIILRSTATVQGDIKAPRVVLEDGAKFRGGVDMGEPADLKKGIGGPSTTGPAKPPEAQESKADTGKDPAEAATKATK